MELIDTLRAHAQLLTTIAIAATAGFIVGRGSRRATTRNAILNAKRPRSTSTTKSSMSVSDGASSAAHKALKGISLADGVGDDGHDVTALGNRCWQPLAERSDAKEHLQKGNGYFSFTCVTGAELDDDAKRHVRTIINLSGYDDEVKENNVPHVDVDDDELMAEHKFIVVKGVYALPGVDCTKLTAELLSSPEYHEACQPGPPKLEKDMDLPENNVRFKKTIVPYVYSITVQLKASVINDAKTLDQLAAIDGVRPTAAVLLERTKRDVSKTDSTLKCKSMLLYYRVPLGDDGATSCVCTNVTVVMLTGIPSVLTRIIDSFGSSGTDDIEETMKRTRAYLPGKLAELADSDDAPLPSPDGTVHEAITGEEANAKSLKRKCKRRQFRHRVANGTRAFLSNFVHFGPMPSPLSSPASSPPSSAAGSSQSSS